MSFPASSTPTRQGAPSFATLDALIDALQAMDHRPLTEAECALILTAAAPALIDYRDTRRRLEVINDLSTPGNVILMPAAPATTGQPGRA